MFLDFFGMPDPSTSWGRTAILLNAVISVLVIGWCAVEAQR